MRALIISPVFPPEPVVSASTSSQIAYELIRRGHDVKVITAFPSKPTGKIYPGYKRTLYQTQRIEERFDLTRCFSFFSSESQLVSRFLENVSFGLTASLTSFVTKRPDVIYANTWPIIAFGLLFIVSRLRNIPLVICIQDVYPESLIVQERIRGNGWLARRMRWIDGIIARGSRAVIVISERFADIYHENRGVQSERVHVVPNWIDSNIILIDDNARRFRNEKNIPSSDFLIIYGGNIGMAAGVETIIESFHYLHDNAPVHLLIAGEGTNLEACRILAENIPGDRISFHTPWPIEETSMVFGAADVLVLPTRGRQSLASLPSKLISYMLAARPVIALALPQSDLAEIIRRSGCGWVIEPNQPKLLAAKVREIISLEPGELARRGVYGRQFALQNFTREACLPAVIRIIENASSQ